MNAVQVLQKELRQLTEHPVEGFKLFLPNENDLLCWNVGIFGPPDTLYQGGYFKAELTFPKNYPFSPPKMRFLTPLWHPNVYRTGEICISILHPPIEDPLSGESVNERWNPTLSVRTILMSVISMMSEPNVSSPANIEASVQYRAWKEKHNNAYPNTIKKQVDESKKLAINDSVVIPLSVEEYLRPTPAEAKADEASGGLAKNEAGTSRSATIVDVFENLYDDED